MTFTLNKDYKVYIRAMELIKGDDWQGAHDIIENLHSPIASHIHAYLHRIEGDNWNADYWYRKAGRERPNISIEEEWISIMGLIE